MSVEGAGRSVFAGVDQDRVLRAFEAATDDGLDSTFFTPASSASPPSPAPSGAWTADPEVRRAFILYGPGILT